VNTDELDSAILRAEVRVLNIQAKLHRWATNPTGLVESPVLSNAARRVREAGRGNPLVVTPAGRPGPTSPAAKLSGSGWVFGHCGDRGSRRLALARVIVFSSRVL